MAFPIDPKEGYYRTPSFYRHDAFGHDGGMDGCSRVRPHSGGDSTPTVAKARGRSVLGGTVLRADFTIYAGNFVEILAPDGWLWLDLHFESRLVRAGDVVAAGDPIGIVGNTGGGGALGSGVKIGRHQHTSRCRDRAAVDRIIFGRVRARYKGETPAQWAAAHGLSDPYPHIVQSVKANNEAEGALVAVSDQQFSDLVGKVDRILQEQAMMRPLFQALRDEQLDEDGIAQAIRADAAAVRTMLTEVAEQLADAGDDTDALVRTLIEPGPRGYSAWDRLRSVANTLEPVTGKVDEVLARLPKPAATS